MTFGGYAYGSVPVGGSTGPSACSFPNCNLIVMEIIRELESKGICIYNIPTELLILYQLQR